MVWIRHASACLPTRAADLIAPRIPPGQAMGNWEWARGNGQWAVGICIWVISTWQRANRDLKLEMRDEECAKGMNPMFIHYNVVGLTNKNVILQLSLKPHFLEERSRAETESRLNSSANEATPCRCIVKN